MPYDPVITVHFEAKDVLSAQRMRFIRSSRFKGMLAAWVVVILALLALLLFPDIIPSAHFNSWGLLAAVALAFILILAVFYWLAPWLDFTRNPIWKTPFTLRLTDETLLLSIDGRQKSTSVQWKRIRKMDENDRAMILYLSSESNFLIIPKSMFTDPKIERRFRKLLAEKSSLKEKDKRVLA